MINKRAIEKLISKGKVEQAFDQLLDYTSQKENEENREFRRLLLQLSANYSSLNSQYINGVVKFQEHNQESKKVVNALIRILEDIELKTDVFISAPMKSFENNSVFSFDTILDIIKPLEEMLKRDFKCDSVYCSMLKVVEEKKVESSNESLKKDLAFLNDSKNFLLIYPEKLHSSCLVEAGYALALGIPSLFVVSDVNHLPYMLRDPKGLTPFNIHIEELKDFNEVLPFIRDNAKKYLRL